MKKNLVFIIPSLEAGGAEKSLVNLLNTLDYQRYAVDLVLLKPGGVFSDLVPKAVNRLELNVDFQYFSRGLLPSCLHFLCRLQFRLLYHRLAFFVISRWAKNAAVGEQQNWKHMRPFIQTLPKRYDVAIGFLEKTSNYFAVDCVNAKVKIGWIHTTYSNSGMESKRDLVYFKHMKAVIGVSPECVADLQQNFPALKGKFQLIYNIVSPTLIRQLADQECPDLHYFEKPVTLLTIARLSPEKGIDIAIEAARILADKGIEFTWLILGEGNERAALTQQIADHQLQNHVFLAGVRVNPYPYVQRATLYVQPSRYEGKSMAIEEAKILHKPVVVTHFSSALDQIEPEVTGFIANQDAVHLAATIERLIANDFLQKQVVDHLQNLALGTEAEIQKLYQLIDSHE